MGAARRALGIAYDYAYLFHIEPRFKMSYGTYLAAPRWARIVFHLSGIVGSPLGLAAAAVLVAGAREPGDRWKIVISVHWQVR